MKRYDAIVILGNGLTQNWKMPTHVYLRLDKSAQLYRQNVVQKIIVCGKWSINFDLANIIPPTTEAEEMKIYLLKLGIPGDIIIKEDSSKDTIGNFYFLKKILEKYAYKKILIICADFHRERVKFISKKILGKGYNMSYVTSETGQIDDKNIIKMQQSVLKRQKDFLREMKTGDDSFLKEKLYTDPYYEEKRPAQVSQQAMGRK